MHPTVDSRIATPRPYPPFPSPPPTLLTARPGVLYQVECGIGARALGIELCGVEDVLNCEVPSLIAALETVVDCRGRRVLASTLLPLDTTTVKVGCGAGQAASSIAAQGVSHLFKLVAERLNLKARVVGGRASHLAASTEGHVGFDFRHCTCACVRDRGGARARCLGHQRSCTLWWWQCWVVAYVQI